jgi:hypothetical protein
MLAQGGLFARGHGDGPRPSPLAPRPSPLAPRPLPESTDADYRTGPVEVKLRPMSKAARNSRRQSRSEPVPRDAIPIRPTLAIVMSHRSTPIDTAQC